jgi:integrase
MNTRQRCQYGNLTRRKRIRTEDVWQFRYYETTPEGRRRRRAKIIGVVSEYPTKADALRIVEQFRLRLNLQSRLGLPITLDALADDYVEKELPLLRYGTQQAHLSSLHRWIRPRWGGFVVHEIKPIEVEQWLRSLPLADKSKVNLRSLLHLVFQHGRRWEITDVNPIDLVRQRGGRRSIPRVLSVHEMRLILGELREPYRTMVLIAACLGLRASEIIGLQWDDLNWEDRTLLVRRSVVQGRVGDTKTEASRLPLPVDSNLADALRAHCSVACTENRATGYLRTARGSHAGRRAFCDGTSNRQRCVPALARLAGTRFGIPTLAYYVELVLTSKSNKNCCGTRPSRAQ